MFPGGWYKLHRSAAAICGGHMSAGLGCIGINKLG